MAESPTPETGTPSSVQSPARTPPALITTEELLQSMASKSPEAQSSTESSPGGSVSRNGPTGRYTRLRSADAGHRLQALILPTEDDLRAAALGTQPTVGPPPRLPHQLSPALSSVLLGWRSLYETCGTPYVLQTLVGECYAPDAVFEDAVVSARGQEAIYKQFALLGVAVRAVQVGAYSLSVEPLVDPVVVAPTLALLPPGPKLKATEPPPPAQPQRAGARPGALPRTEAAAGPPGGPGPAAAGTTAAAEPQPRRQPRTRPQPLPEALPGMSQLHLTRVAVENVQSFTLAVPGWLAWFLGGKGPGLQLNLYVTSILLVVSDAPLAMGSDSGGGAAADVTARRLASAAAALGAAATAEAAAAAAGGNGTDPCGGGSNGGGGGGGGSGSGTPAWRIVHQVDHWHNVPLVWWRLRRALCLALNAVLSPLLGI